MVNEYFREHSDETDSIIVNNSKDKEACLIQDKDSVMTAYMAMMNFYFVKLKIHENLGNKESGWVGYPIKEYFETSFLQRKLYIQLYEKKEPPFTNSKRRISLSVPEPILSKIDWQNIRQILGGSNGYQWGKYLTTVGLEFNRQIQVYAASASVSETIATNLAQLSSLEIRKISKTELPAVGIHGVGAHREMKSVRVYPATVKLLRRKQTGKKVVVAETQKLSLYTSSKPQNWDSEIQRVYP